MGYYTRYTLAWEPLDDCSTEALAEIMAKEIESSDYMLGALRADGRALNARIWHYHEKDMEALSLKYPGILFTLSGESEESGDLWRKYFLNGKCEVARASITFSPCTLRGGQ